MSTNKREELYFLVKQIAHIKRMTGGIVKIAFFSEELGTTKRNNFKFVSCVDKS